MFLLSGALVAPLDAYAQPSRMPVIGILHGGWPGPYARHLAIFREALSAAGYVDTKNVAVEYRWAEGSNDRLSEMAGELVSGGVAVIAAMTFPAALAAKAA
jgi:putative ABC transport system substrate-binding protein